MLFFIRIEIDEKMDLHNKFYFLVKYRFFKLYKKKYSLSFYIKSKRVERNIQLFVVCKLFRGRYTYYIKLIRVKG